MFRDGVMRAFVSGGGGRRVSGYWGTQSYFQALVGSRPNCGASSAFSFRWVLEVAESGPWKTEACSIVRVSAISERSQQSESATRRGRVVAGLERDARPSKIPSCAIVMEGTTRVSRRHSFHINHSLQKPTELSTAARLETSDPRGSLGRDAWSILTVERVLRSRRPHERDRTRVGSPKDTSRDPFFLLFF